MRSTRFLEDPAKFIIDGLLELVGIPPAAFWALVAKIGRSSSDIADDPMGFANNLMSGARRRASSGSSTTSAPTC